ncbi:cysteine proteinase [Fomitopsis serialis]|uniref:cysteine proteinase n=1 Tax=Fomitopsis serialis TaxID=139415 RepID=UPI00200782DD|nr:cysteine proteinase [Neoantrodia serialis]KAH9934725.1 cysteine proteinase [Neoantrodia serialis]
MPPKRNRRTSPSHSGLTAGERLKRAKLTDSRVYSAWGWVGVEVADVSQITQQHRLATCGFSENSSHPLCLNRYAVPRSSPSVKGDSNGGGKVAAGELEDDIIVISDDEAPRCNSKVCKANPYCLNYLGQEKWDDEVKAREAFVKTANLGDNPAENARRPGHPVGLRNLGATCYANAYIQVWFQDLPFRNGVYRCQLPEDEKFNLEVSPIFQLQVTFAAMQEGIESAFNPVKLVESLKLRTTEQQDAQEFSKLFMAHLDTEFQKQADPTLKTLIANQFQGKHTYITTCQECQYRSERSSDFLELEVTIKNNSTLEERLGALLEPEMMSGDNQYSCPRCDGLQDAKRHMELSSLPSVLHFSLLRFVYDLSTMERKKSKHNISFPTTIDMDRFLGPPESGPRKRRRKGDGQEKNLYQLRGILLHKGASAYHGHYEAQVFDVQTQSWYQFNDETVTKIDSLAGKVQNGPKAGPKAKYMQYLMAKLRRKPRSAHSDSDIEILEYTTVGMLFMSISTESNRMSRYISSKDAYMLVYSRVDDVKPASQANGKRPVATSSLTDLDNHRVGVSLPRPPQRAEAAVNALNKAHTAACEAYGDKKHRTLAQFDEIRQRIMGIVKSWNLTSRDQDCVVASRRGLESWVSRHLKASPSESEPGSKDAPEPASSSPTEDHSVDTSEWPIHVIVMSQVLCEHGRLNPSKAGDMKLITTAAHQRIAAEDDCELAPELRPSDICEDCVALIFNEKLYHIEHPRLVDQFDQLSGVEEDEPGYWISKQWLKDWRLSKPKMHVASQEDPPPDAADFVQDVKCEHDGLSANVTARRRISSEARLLLKQIFPTWEALSTEAELCPVCEALVHISKEDKREFRRQAEEEKARLKHMYDNALNGNTALLENVPCAIVPAQFVRAWRQWLLRPAEVPRPDRLNNSLFVCEHGLLVLDPNVNSDMDTSVAIIKRTDWNTIEELYSGDPLIAIENTGARIEHELSVCAPCRLKRKSTFDVTELTIRILGRGAPTPTPETYSEEMTAGRVAETAKPSTLITYGSRKAPALRQSSRIRQVKEHGKRRRVTVTSAMSVKDLKVMLQDELGTPVISQRLFHHGHELDNSSSTLSSLGILSNDLLDLQEQAEDINLLSDSDDEPAERHGKRRAEGQGFGGTLLSGLLASDGDSQPSPQPEDPSTRACPACTFAMPLTPLHAVSATLHCDCAVVTDPSL